MNRPAKLGRKSSEEVLIKKPETAKKKPSPRNPLKDLNCFSFLHSNSSSRESLPRSKAQRTPKSAPPNPRALLSKNPTNPSKSHKKPSKPTSENHKLPGSKSSLKPRWNQNKPSSKDQIMEAGDASSGKNRHLNFGLASTPEKTLLGFCTELGSETKEGEKNLSNTPNSNTTPPIQASISPEIACGSNVDPTPVCFAAGHVIAGVHDRRKCRPRGLLTVGGGGGFSTGCSSQSRISSAPPPIAEASMHWLSSLSENVRGCQSGSSHCPDEASVNWLISPNGDLGSGLAVPEVSPLGTRYSSDHGVWRFSPTNSNTSRSPILGGLLGLNSPVLETTPSSGNGIRRTPTSGSSISPFSAIIQRAAATSSGFRHLRPLEERGGYRYGSARESSSLSGECLSEGNAISTPSSYSNSRRKGILSPFYLNSTAKALGPMRLSPQNDASDISPPLPGLSFQFGCPATPSNSIDLTCFNKPSSEKTSVAKDLPSKDKGLSGSDLRISWREGLVSRIFEMGELGCYQWLSDDEDNVNYLGEEKVESEFDFKFGLKNRSSVLKEGNDQQMVNGFGSFEFPCVEVGVLKCEAAKVSPPGPISCAESISTEGGGLISSGDSDWTLFYKNHLFEVFSGIILSEQLGFLAKSDVPRRNSILGFFDSFGQYYYINLVAPSLALIEKLHAAL